jgi:hypothetical protein
MHKKYWIPLSLVIASLFSGCQKLKEDPKGLLNPDQYYQSQKNLDAAIAGIYGSFNLDHGVGGVSFMVNAFGADDLSAHPASNKAEMRDFDRLAGTSDNPRIHANWVLYFMAISNANAVLANYQKVNSADATEDSKNNAAAQALFIRAWCYFRLVKEFGTAPLILGPATVELRPSLASPKEIYDQVVADLQKAIDLFPASAVIEADRANPLSAKTLLADVYLNMAGWPLNQSEYYALAAATAKEVITSGKYTLVDDYATVFTTNNNSEATFTIKFDISNKPTRNRGTFSMNEAEQPLGGPSGWHDFTTESNFYKNAPKCKRTWQTFSDTLYILNPDGKTYTRKPWNTVGTLQVLYKKFRYGLGTPGNGDGCAETPTTLLTGSPSSGKDNDLFRYPMVLLDFAEASAMANNAVSQECYDAINLVRHRAGLPNLMTAPSAAAFRDSVVHERAYEFAGEYGIRWMDIQRLQLLPQIIAERNPNEVVGLSASGAADPTTRYLAPIPLSELNLNPEWEQNAGY